MAENQVKVWRMTDLHDADMLKGNYAQHTYPWHAHEEFTFGVVTRGGLHLQTRSTDALAQAGSFVLINAEEVHQGTTAVPKHGIAAQCIFFRRSSARRQSK